MIQKRYVEEESQAIDQFRESEQVLFNNLKVASIGKVVGITDKGYLVELTPKLDREVSTIQTINFIYEKRHRVYPGEETKGDEGKRYIVQAYDRVKIEEKEALGRFVLILFLDNYVSQIGNDKLNIDSSKTKHGLENGYALQFIDMWPGKGEKL